MENVCHEETKQEVTWHNTLSHHMPHGISISVLVQGPYTLLPVQLYADPSRKTTDNGPNICRRTGWSSWLLISAWLTSGCNGHIGSDSQNFSKKIFQLNKLIFWFHFPPKLLKCPRLSILECCAQT